MPRKPATKKPAKRKPTKDPAIERAVKKIASDIIAERTAYLREHFPAHNRNAYPDGDCIIVEVSDSHGASKLAPINPETRLVNLVDNSPITIAPNAIGQMIWDDFGVRWPGEALDIADGRNIHFRHRGDVVQGTKHSEELHATNIAHQVEIARMQLDPWLRLPNVKSVRLATGTGAHEFGEGAGSALLAAIVEQTYKIPTGVGYHDRETIAGVLFDAAHHGPSGTRNAMHNYAIARIVEDMLDGKRPADVIVRGHVHTPGIEHVSVRDHWAWMVVAPALQYPNDYARNKAKSPARFCFGVTVYDIRGGKIHGAPIKLWRTVDTRREVITNG